MLFAVRLLDWKLVTTKYCEGDHVGGGDAEERGTDIKFSRGDHANFDVVPTEINPNDICSQGGESKCKGEE
jgi:hypothetical protein